MGKSLLGTKNIKQEESRVKKETRANGNEGSMFFRGYESSPNQRSGQPNKKKGVNFHSSPLLFLVISRKLENRYIDRGWAFFALLNIKSYPLAFMQGSKSRHTDS